MTAQSARSVIEIDVRDQAFKDFRAVFDKYQTQLAKMPGMWGQVNKALGKAGVEANKSFLEQTKATGKVRDNIRDAVGHLERLGTKARNSHRSFADLARTTKDIATNVANTSFQIAKWAMLGTGLGGLGVGLLTGAATNLRRTSGNYGVRPGELQSARVHLGQYFNAEGMLGNIADAQSDLSKRWVLQGLGVRDFNQSPGATMASILPQMVQQFIAGGRTQQFFQAHGFGDLIDLPSLRYLSNLPKGELAGAISGYQADTKNLDVRDAELRKLQELNQQLERAKTQIFETFVKGLAPITPQLIKLSQGLTNLLTKVASNNTVQTVAGMTGKGWNYILDTPADTFFGDVKTLLLGPGGTRATLTPEAAARAKRMASGTVTPAAAGRPTKAAGLYYLSRLEQQFGLPSGLLGGIWGAESNFGDPRWMRSPAGAEGDFQLMPFNSKPFGVNPFDFYQSARRAAQMESDLLKRFGGNTAAAVAGYNMSPDVLAKVIKAHPNDWLAHLNSQTRDYVPKVLGAVGNMPGKGGATITVVNATGGQAVVLASQLPY